MEHLHISIVDDEPGMLMGMDRILSGKKISFDGFEDELTISTRRSSTAQEFLTSLKDAVPDIVLLDYKLPDKDGLEVMRELSGNKVETTIIMTTAYASIDVAITATKNGAFDFVPKPFTPDELITSIKKAARQIYLHRKAKSLAEEKKRIRFEFVSVLAHELKSPINAIDGYMGILKESSAISSSEQMASIIGRCETRLGGMRSLISDLLDLTGIESGEKKREVTSIDMSAIIADVMESHSQECLRRKITVEVSAEGNPTITADREEMNMVVNNLISNAVKYNRDGGSVKIASKNDGEKFTFEVSDTGIGMTEEERSKIFNDFVRIKNDKTVKISGTGLGLSTVKKIATLYDGSVSVSENPGGGSRFAVELKLNSKKQ